MYDPYGMFSMAAPIAQGHNMMQAGWSPPGGGGGFMGGVDKFMSNPLTGAAETALDKIMGIRQQKKENEMRKKQLEEQEKARIQQQQQQNTMAMLAIANYANSLQPGRAGR